MFDREGKRNGGDENKKWRRCMNPKRLVHTVKGERTIRPEHPPSILDPGPPLPFPPTPMSCTTHSSPIRTTLHRFDSIERISDRMLARAPFQCRRFVRASSSSSSSTRPDRTTEFLAPASPSSNDQRGNTSELRRAIPPITYQTVHIAWWRQFCKYSCMRMPHVGALSFSLEDDVPLEVEISFLVIHGWILETLISPRMRMAMLRLGRPRAKWLQQLRRSYLPIGSSIDDMLRMLLSSAMGNLLLSASKIIPKNRRRSPVLCGPKSFRLKVMFLFREMFPALEIMLFGSVGLRLLMLVFQCLLCCLLPSDV